MSLYCTNIFVWLRLKAIEFGNRMANNELTKAQWLSLKCDGTLFLPKILSKNEVLQLRDATARVREKFPYGYVYNDSYKKSAPKKQIIEPPIEPAQVLTVFDVGFLEPIFLKLADLPYSCRD